MLSRQEIVNRICEHFAEQKEPSLCEHDCNTCAYRGLNGNMCWIGLLIPDHAYKSDMEETSIPSSSHKQTFERSLVVKGLRAGNVDVLRDEDFLRDLQDIHDRWIHREKLETAEEINLFITGEKLIVPMSLRITIEKLGVKL